MATLDDGRVVHVDRIDSGDLHAQIMEGKIKVRNRWLKPDQLKKKK